MKKFLLLAAAAIVAASASAEVLRDVTPAAYKFDSGLPLPLLSSIEPTTLTESPSGAWNCNNYYAAERYVAGDWADGMILARPSGDFTESGVTKMIAGLKVYDFGGTLGKCLVLNTISGFNEAITEITGYDMGITTSEYTGYHQLYWVYDPEKGCEEGEHFRVHIELNVFTNPVTTDNVWGAYTNNNCNSVEPADDNLTTNRDIAGVRFAKYWGEVEGTFAEEDMGEGNEYTNENYEYEWNPERFMVYEYDTNAHGSGLGENEDGTANVMGVLPLKIKMEIPAGSAIIFKAVDIYVVPDEDTISWKNPATEEYEDVTDLYYRRNLESKYYTIDPANVGIRNIVADNALNVNVNGRTLSTNVAARVYNTNGQLVRVLKAGQEATLAAGLYIVNAGANSQKVIVK